MTNTQDEDDSLSPKFPIGVRIAGAIWVLIGLFVIINITILRFVSGLSLTCGASLFLPVVGIAFVVNGLQTLRGRTKSTVGNAIGSIVVGILISGVSAVLIFIAAVGGDAKGGLILAGTGFGVLTLGVVLMVTGILAIRARHDYLAWRLYRLTTTPGEQK